MRTNFELNSCADSWYERAKRVLNGDNGGNERDSSEIAQETRPEISRRNFWCNKNFGEFFLGGRFTGSGPKMRIN